MGLLARWVVSYLQLALARVRAPFPGAVELRLEPSAGVTDNRGVIHLMRVTSPPPESILAAALVAWFPTAES